jgi:hypothetical protein
MKTLMLVCLTALLTGCINTEHSSDQKNSAAGANADGLVCKTEKPTGSHRSIRICRTVSQIERDRKEADEVTRRIRNQAQINPG